MRKAVLAGALIVVLVTAFISYINFHYKDAYSKAPRHLRTDTSKNKIPLNDSLSGTN